MEAVKLGIFTGIQLVILILAAVNLALGGPTTNMAKLVIAAFFVFGLQVAFRMMRERRGQL